MSHKASLACTGAFAAAATLAGINPALSHTIVDNRAFAAALDIQQTVIVHLGRALGPGTYSLSWLVVSIDTHTTQGTSASRSPKAEADVWLRQAKGGRTTAPQTRAAKKDCRPC